jgi:MarR family protein
MTAAGDRFQPRRGRIAAHKKPPELLIQSCLESMGIFQLVEWDVLAFVHRHGTSLASAPQIAHLIGHDSTLVGSALDRLEQEKLIERSRTSQGVCLYRIPDSMDAGYRRSLQQLVSLSEARAGRLLLTKRLKTAPSESGQREQLAVPGK